MSTYKRKTWQEKLADGRKPHVEISDKDFAGVRAGQRMLVPTPKLIDEYIRQIPAGTTLDPAILRNDLALEYGAEITCPLTTGISLRIVAEAAHEEFQKGKPVEDITPFWRIIGVGSNTAKKLAFGTTFIKAQRKKENIR